MAAGPFAFLPDDVLQLTPTHFDFTGFTADNLGDLEASAAEVDSGITDALNVLDDPSDPAPDFDYHGLVDSLGATTFVDEQAQTPLIQDADPTGDVLLGDAVNTAPGEAFLPQPPPFDPNQDPTVNLDYGTGAKTPSENQGPSNVGPGHQFNQLVTAAGYDLTLVDLTNLVPNSFVVGDQFKLTITGPPLQQIFVEAWHDGVHMEKAPFGAIGADGKFVVSGAMEPSAVGAWSETWYGGGTMIQNVAFFVVPQP